LPTTNPSRLRLALLVVLAVTALVAASCGEDDGDNEGEDELAGGVDSQTLSIESYDFYFEPTSLSVERSTQVTLEFENLGENAHSFTIPDLDVEVEADGGESGEITFSSPDEPGSLDFFCKYHPDEMTGTLSIGGVGEPLDEDAEGVDDGTESEDDSDVAPGTDTGY
jgi:plastocyanin